MPVSTATNLYTLFIGIDDYAEHIVLEQKVAFPRLHGCVNDINRVQTALTSDPDFHVFPKILLNEKATKEALIAAFENHLSKAKAGDSILIYFSGHGTIEMADKTIWTAEADGKIEGLVCYYDKEMSAGKFILADKELRFLLNNLWKKTGASITAMFDCCHSGDNVRAMAEKVEENAIPKLIERKARGAYAFKQRAYSDFIFSKNIPDSAFVGKGIDDVLPPGRFIQMAAAESNESALEESGAGVFTTAFLATLAQSGGHLSYRDLHSQIANQLRFRFTQRPKLYAPDGAEDLKNEGFLRKKLGEGAASATLTYNKSEGWLLNRGSLHGVQLDSVVAVLLGSDKAANGTVKSVHLGYSVVQFNQLDTTEMRSKISHRASITGLDLRPLKVHFTNKNGGGEKAKQFHAALLDSKNDGLIVFEDDVERADYSLWLYGEMAYITKPNDAFRPLTKPISLGKENAAELIAADLRHIAAWQRWATFKAEGQGLSAKALKVEFFVETPDGNDELLNVDKNGILKAEFLRDTQRGYRRDIKMRITNNSDGDLYVAMAFLDWDFASYNSFFHEDVIHLEKGSSRWMRDQRENKLPLKLDQQMVYYNWETAPSKFTFIFSKENFDASSLALSALPAPNYPGKMNTRGNVDQEEDQKFERKQWGTTHFELQMANPHYNALPKAIIEELLPENMDDFSAELAHFALGLYTEQGQDGQWRIRKEVLAKEEKRGLAWDLTLKTINTWSNFWRNRRFGGMVDTFPNRKRIVSEGDSWFQHPLLNDIIDQVGAVYPTYCLAAAGDTIANYLKSSDFIKEIERVKPEVFLLSGGGNDILGDSLAGFLNEFSHEDCPEGQDCDRFFNEKLEDAVENLLMLYSTTFAILKAEYPNLKVIVHGYDYPLPLEPQSTKMSWLSKYLDGKNIFRAGDRLGASHYLMDRFNTALAKLADETNGQVHYLDLRGIVKADEWYDEIHPNNAGYQKVALRFLKKIAELSAETT